MVIHRDQARQWLSKGPPYEEEFKLLLETHMQKYENALASLITPAGSTPSGQTQTTAVVVAAAGGEGEDEGAVEEEGGSDAPPVTFESVEKLQAADPIATRVASEFSGVELLLTTSKKIFLLADKVKSIPKWTILGGFGTGKKHGLRWCNIFCCLCGCPIKCNL